MLSTTEFKLLYLLANNIGETFTVNELIDYIEITGISTLYVYIQKLREKIEKTLRIHIFWSTIEAGGINL